MLSMNAGLRKSRAEETLFNIIYYYRLSSWIEEAIQEALRDPEDPLLLFRASDAVIAERHYKLCGGSRYRLFEEPWDAMDRDEEREPIIVPANYEAFSLGSGRGRECSFAPAVRNGGCLFRTSSGTFLYDPGKDFNRTVVNSLCRKQKIPQLDVNGILVSHRHDDHMGGLESAISLTTDFFAHPRTVPVIAPVEVPWEREGIDDLLQQQLETFSVFHGPQSYITEVYHYWIGQDTLVISDGLFFQRIGKRNPLFEGIPAAEWIQAIDRSDVVLTEAVERMLNRIGRVERAYVTPQCSDILPGDFAKLSGPYFLLKHGFADSVILVGWGAENVFGGRNGYPRICLPEIWSEAFLCMGLPLYVLDDFCWI